MCFCAERLEALAKAKEALAEQEKVVAKLTSALEVCTDLKSERGELTTAHEEAAIAASALEQADTVVADEQQAEVAQKEVHASTALIRCLVVVVLLLLQ